MMSQLIISKPPTGRRNANVARKKTTNLNKTSDNKIDKNARTKSNSPIRKNLSKKASLSVTSMTSDGENCNLNFNINLKKND